jgi:hypothetical protein
MTQHNLWSGISAAVVMWFFGCGGDQDADRASSSTGGSAGSAGETGMSGQAGAGWTCTRAPCPGQYPTECGTPETGNCAPATPACNAMNSADGMGLAGSACEELPAACSADLTCDCLVQTYQSGPEATCLGGHFRCSAHDDGTFTLVCSMP